MPKLSSSPDTSKKAFDGTSPASVYARATLGVNAPTPRHRSLPGTQEGQPSPVPTRPSFSSKTRLDPSDPSTWTSRHTPSFSEHRRAASETVAREDVPTIRLQDDGDKPGGSGSLGVNQDGSSAVHSSTASSESHRSPIATSTIANPPEVKHVTPSAPPAPGLDAPVDEEADSRRFSNQSTSFSSVTTDSDRIGRVSQESDPDNENALQESSGSSSSDSDSSSSDQEEVVSPVGERGRQRDKNREPKAPEPQVQEPPAKVPTEPVIRGSYSIGTLDIPD